MGADLISVIATLSDDKYPDSKEDVSLIFGQIKGNDVMVQECVDLIANQDPEFMEYTIDVFGPTRIGAVRTLLYEGADWFYNSGGRIGVNFPITGTALSLYVAGERSWGDTPEWYDAVLWFVECSDIINKHVQTGILHGGPPYVEDMVPRDIEKPTTSKYEVSVAMNFDAVDVEDAVRQMAAWLEDNHSTALMRVVTTPEESTTVDAELVVGP